MADSFDDGGFFGRQAFWQRERETSLFPEVFTSQVCSLTEPLPYNLARANLTFHALCTLLVRQNTYYVALCDGV